MGDFVKVASASDVGPGEMMVVELDGVEIVVANLGSEFVAFQNKCSHRGGPLGEGLFANGVVECPFHAGQFDVRTGGVISPPPTESIRTYAVEVDGGDVKIARD